ncbi:MAG TPA: lipoyl synthase [bacterium]|mgnify:FL=1|nr:lipoyl synthase [bacterium]
MDRLPPWLRQSKRDVVKIHQMKKRLRGRRLHTVCEEARCPNMAECFARPTATFMILGNRCTRNCGFCNIEHGQPPAPDPQEPQLVANAAKEMELTHVVLTSVTRDDLPLGGAEHFRACVTAIKTELPSATVEVLTPDFRGSHEALDLLVDAPLDVFNHNVETVPRLYATARAQADYRTSLDVLAYMARRMPQALIKSGLMLGLGEEKEEIEAVLRDLHAAGVRAVTIGQYLRPRLSCLPVVRYIPPHEFATWGTIAGGIGFTNVAAAPLVRSSYLADRMMCNRE